MNVPVQILEHLKCSNCEDLLSCGPVLVKQDGNDICGRCSNLEKTAVPNKPYNQLAEMCMFPCKYEAQGCFEKISFSCMKQHEADCEFRTYVCPVLPPGSCEWIGPRNGILEHTQESHPEKILEHPCELEYDVWRANSKTFLTTAFNILFLVYVKVCLKTYTIYHSVRQFGEVENSTIFKYQIHIENDCGTVIKKGQVTPQGCLAMQENSSLPVKIITLIEALNGFKNVKFKVTIQKSMKCNICEVIKTADQIEVYNKISNIFYCKACLTILTSCKNASMGCASKGMEDSLALHIELFCTFTKRCTICKRTIKEFNMLEHMRTKNHVVSEIHHLFAKYWHIRRDKGNEPITISFKNMSYLFVYVRKENNLNAFYLQGRPDAHRNKTKIVLILRNSETKFASHYIMDEFFSSKIGQFIWQIELPDNKLQPFIDNNNFDIGVNIYYND